jgi:hypothetical protein
MLPAFLAKNKREFVAPIGALTAALLGSIPGDADLYFPADRGDKVFGGWSKQKELFDKQIVDADYIVAPWVLHDLRKFYATTHAKIGTPIHLTERLLHHISASTTGGLVGVYQLHTWLPEMRVAVHNFDRHIATLLERA